jgi:hypothetical protein
VVGDPMRCDLVAVLADMVISALGTLMSNPSNQIVASGPGGEA